MASLAFPFHLSSAVSSDSLRAHHTGIRRSSFPKLSAHARPSSFSPPSTATIAAAGKSTSKSLSSSSTASAASSSAKVPSVSRGSGLKKPLDISPALQKFLDLPMASRADTMKLVWDYIKGHNLQHPDDRRRIVCDEKLKDLLGKDECNFLELAKLLNPHFLKSS